MNLPGVPTLDLDAADMLVAGHIPSSDVPPPYDQVAAVLAALAAPGAPPEHAAAMAAGQTLAAVARETPSRRWVPRRLGSFRLSFKYKVAVLGMTLFLVLTGGLAAAGALPDGAQGVAQNVLRKVGIHVPGPNPNAGNHPFERGKSGKPKKHIPGQPAKPAQNPHTQTSPSEGGSS